MNNEVKQILEAVQRGEMNVDDALLRIKTEPFEDIGYAKVDLHRKVRQGAAEVIYGAGKTPEQIIGIAETMKRGGQNTILITRLSAEAAEIVQKAHDLHYHAAARVGIIGEMPEKSGIGKIVVATGGTSDIPVSEEAALTAETITKTNIAQLAFGQFFGENLGAWFVAICLLFFAFSTILSWNLFAKLNVEWLFGKKGVMPFTIIALAFIFMGSLLSNDLVWELADMFNQLMVIPNAIALFALSGAVLAIANAKHDKRALDAAEERLEDQERAAINAMVEEDKRK